MPTWRASTTKRFTLPPTLPLRKLLRGRQNLGYRLECFVIRWRIDTCGAGKVSRLLLLRLFYNSLPFYDSGPFFFLLPKLVQCIALKTCIVTVS